MRGLVCVLFRCRLNKMNKKNEGDSDAINDYVVLVEKLAWFRVFWVRLQKHSELVEIFSIFV